MTLKKLFRNLKTYLRKCARTILAELFGALAISYWIFSLKIFRFEKEYVLSVYFHNPSIYTFVIVIRFLKLIGFDFISMLELKRYLTSKHEIRNKSVLVTFDDAWRDNLNLRPVIEEMAIPICLFVPTDPVENGEFWWEKIKRAEGYESDSTIKKLKLISNKRRLKYINRLSDEKKRDAMSWTELLNFQSSIYVTIGSHSKTHSLLDKCSDQELYEELFQSKITLEEKTGKNIDTLAYPNGNFDDRVQKMASRCGYCIAFTTKPGLIAREKHLMQLPRFAINDNGLFFENFAKAIGAWQHFRA